MSQFRQMHRTAPMPSSEEHLRRLAEEFGGGEQPPSRRPVAIVIVVGLLIVVLAGSAIWWALPRVAGGDGSSGGAFDKVASWWLARQPERLLAPGADPVPVTFEVQPGETLPHVAQRLEAEGLIRDAFAFRVLARVRGLDRQVQAGQTVLSRDMPAQEVLEALLSGQGPVVVLTIPEGWRAEQVAGLVESMNLGKADDFLRLVDEGQADQPSLADRPAGSSLEGYLFPDTYQFDPQMGPDAVVQRLLDTFEARVTPEMRRLAETVDLSLHEVVTLASIVEREASLPAERARVARVYLNRLATAPFLLNADPTVQYALGFQADTGRWWKQGLTRDDLALESPYNTYTSPGLPPGPIASPGLAAIRAVLSPESGDWMYFVANEQACDGSHVFAITWDEHLANIARYQTGGCAP